MPTNERFYLPTLDGLRFVAFIAVFLHHTLPEPMTPIFSGLKSRLWIGIELFFVISSFLFFVLFRIEYRRTGAIDVRRFFIRRLLRLYPLMVAAPLLYMFVAQEGTAGAWQQWRNIITFTDNLMFLPTYARAIPYASHLWTLSFEFQIYLALPVIFLICVRLSPRNAMFFLAALWAAAIAFRTGYAAAMAPHPTIYFAPWLRPDSVLIGMMLAISLDSIRGRPAIALAVLLASLFGFALLPDVYVAGIIPQVPVFILAAFAAGALLYLVLDEHGWAAVTLNAQPIKYLGKISFGLYVYHWLAMELSDRAAGVAPAQRIEMVPLEFAAWMVMTFAITVTLSVVSYHGFEYWFLRLKERRAVVPSRPI